MVNKIRDTDGSRGDDHTGTSAVYGVDKCKEKGGQETLRIHNPSADEIIEFPTCEPCSNAAPTLTTAVIEPWRSTIGGWTEEIHRTRLRELSETFSLISKSGWKNNNSMQHSPSVSKHPAMGQGA
jgi:hypothetical protein